MSDGGGGHSAMPSNLAPMVRSGSDRFVERLVDPEFTVDVVAGQPRVLVFRRPPTRLHVPDDGVAYFDLVTKTNLSIVGRRPGVTLLNLWFSTAGGGEEIVSYLVRVFPDPDARERQEAFYAALERQINEAFPNSVVELSLVGTKLIVSGQAHDILEANQIIALLEDTAPMGGGHTAEEVPSVGPEGGDPVDPASFDLKNSRNIINMMVVPGAPQVMLRVTVAEINRAGARALGMEFTFVDNEGDFTLNSSPSDLLGTALESALVQFTGKYQFQAAISALRSLNMARSLAEPNLVTLNGKPAEFQAGGRFPVPVVTGATSEGLQGVEYVPFGVSLQFTPYIVDEDKIRLVMSAEVSARQPDNGITLGNSTVSGLDSRSFTTTVELRDGEALAVAGLIQTSFGSTSERLPLLGDLPLIGWLFGSNGTSSSEQELVVIVSPELVSPLASRADVPSLPGDDSFEPDDLEFYLFNRLESRNTEDFRSSARTDLTRMRKFRRGDEQYIEGPSGFSNP